MQIFAISFFDLSYAGVARRSVGPAALGGAMVYFIFSCMVLHFIDRLWPRTIWSGAFLVSMPSE